MVIPIVIDFPEILAYGIDSSNAILLDLYNTFTFEETPLFKTHPTLKSFIAKTAKSVPTLVNRLKQLRKNPKQEQELSMNAFRLINTNFNSNTASQLLIDKIIKNIIVTKPHLVHWVSKTK